MEWMVCCGCPFTQSTLLIGCGLLVMIDWPAVIPFIPLSFHAQLSFFLYETIFFSTKSNSGMKKERLKLSLLGQKHITFYSVIWIGESNSMKEATNNSLQSHFFIQTKKSKLSFYWIQQWLKRIDEWNKKYYNSISRQSGIVHKDKAMRQLDLDLWEMNWLVAGPAHSAIQQFISICSSEWADWLNCECWRAAGPRP